jgi:hypothetical protein
MASWQRTCSYARRAPNDHRLIGAALPGVALTLLASACGRADDSPRPGQRSPPPAPPSVSQAMPPAQQALCIPADEGRLKARLSGSINAEIDWSAPMPQCRGGLRPDGDGVRLVYKGEVPGQGSLLVVIGVGPLHAGENAGNVPANLTLVREGAGRFYATQGDDKCAMDEVKQEPVGTGGHSFRLIGRGYCIQPARAVGGEGSVLVSRFDVSALVDYK